MRINSKAESCASVVRSTEPELMSPFETQDLIAWTQCLLTWLWCSLHLRWDSCWVVCQPRHTSNLLRTCAIDFIEKKSQITIGTLITLLTYPSWRLTENWQILQSWFSRSHPWALCLALLPEATSPHHQTQACAHTSSALGHQLRAWLQPENCSGAASVSLPSDSFTLQWPRAEVSSF